MHDLESWFLSVGDLPFTLRSIGGDLHIVLLISDLYTSKYFRISKSSYRSAFLNLNLLLMLGVNPKVPRGSKRGAFLVHGSDMDLNFYAQIYSRSKI